MSNALRVAELELVKKVSKELLRENKEAYEQLEKLMDLHIDKIDQKFEILVLKTVK